MGGRYSEVSYARAIDRDRERILQELQVDVGRREKGHHGVFAVEVLINTLRVTLHVTREEIESALEHLCRLQLIEKAVQVGGKEVLSITDVGRRVLKTS